MNISEARESLLVFESGDERPGGSFGPLQWVTNYREMSEAGQAECHAVANTLIHKGTLAERHYAMQFWGAVSPPPGGSDALAKLFLAEDPPDPTLRLFLGTYMGHKFAEPTAQALVARFVADPIVEADLAAVAVVADRRGEAWLAFARLVQASDDLRTLYRQFDVAYRAGEVDAFCALIARKPRGLLKELVTAVPLPPLQKRMRTALGFDPP